MRTIISTLALTLTLTLGLFGAGCGGDGGTSCERVTDHFLSVAPPELKDQLGDKKSMIEQCEKKMSVEERKCALAAKDFGAIMQCRKAKG
ncbi:MAG TPA: hypothetical protein VML75_19545 [Kofleriaceae bacterium]|nr:hypothetical protein [Kofleriaceae bacterium]